MLRPITLQMRMVRHNDVDAEVCTKLELWLVDFIMSRLNRRQSKICSHGERNTDLVRMTLPLVSSMSVASNDSDDHNQAPAYSLRLRDRHLHQRWWSIFTDIILSPPPPVPPPFTPSFTAIPPLTSVLDSSAHSSHPRAKIIHLPLSSFIPQCSFLLFPKGTTYSRCSWHTIPRFPWRKVGTEPESFIWSGWSKVWNDYVF